MLLRLFMGGRAKVSMALTDSGEQNEKMVHAGIYVTVLMVAGGLQTLHSLRRR